MRLPQVEGDDVGREKVGDWLEGVCGGGRSFLENKMGERERERTNSEGKDKRWKRGIERKVEEREKKEQGSE